MDIPLQVTFRNMDPSDAVEAKVRERAEKLETYFGHITSCRVVIEAPHRHQNKGKHYRVRIDIGVPARPDIVVSRDPGKKSAHEDVYVAVRDAFDAARRQLEDHHRKISGKVKAHEAPQHGKVMRLFPYEGYGFIETSDGQEIYFHKNAVIETDFEKLEVGDKVRLAIAERESEKGAQATSVRPIGKHNIVER